MARAMLDSGKYFPPLLVQMVHVGESSGRLDRTLLELAEHYDHRISTRNEFLRGIAWPVIELLMAVFIETGQSFLADFNKTRTHVRLARPLAS